MNVAESALLTLTESHDRWKRWSSGSAAPPPSAPLQDSLAVAVVPAVPRPSSSMVELANDDQALLADNRSEYSMATVHGVAAERTALLSSSASTGSYGTTSPSQPSTRRILVNATLKMAVIFVLSTALLGGTLWLALPTLEEYVPSLFVECPLPHGSVIQGGSTESEDPQVIP